MRKALVLGATGFVGSYLLEDLLRDSTYGEVVAITRKPLEIQNPKLKNIIGDFNTLASQADHLAVDDVYIALGTTKAKTPNLAQYYQIDHDYPVLAARLAKERGAKSVSIVTAIGANEKSRMFYVRTKGEVERDVISLGYHRTNIFQPSMIMGHRQEERALEKAFIGLFAVINAALIGPLTKYRGTDGKDIAHAMSRAPKSGDPRVSYYRWREMHALTRSSRSR